MAEPRTDEEGVRQASDAFYAALNRLLTGDSAAMDEVWAQGADSTTMHPIGGRELGWSAVQDSWRKVARIASGGEVELLDRMARAKPDLAYEIGTEHVDVTLAGERIQSRNRVTCVYRRTAGEWKVVHHQVDADPAMRDRLERLQ